MLKTRTLAAALLVSVAPALAHAGAGGKGHAEDKGTNWVASWATSPSTYFIYTPPPQPLNASSFPLQSSSQIQYTAANIQPDLAFPFPNATSSSGASAVDQTIRSIVKPDLWGKSIRIRFSNYFGNKPVTFDAVTVGLQEYAANIVNGTLTPVTFGGSKTVTIAPGERVFSDAVRLSFVSGPDDDSVVGRNLAISYSVKGDSGQMTYHPGANQTSFITPQGSGNHTGDLDGFAYEYTTTSWFFVETLDVRARGDTVVICAFGDSITDGTHTTLNINDRWMNVLSRRLHDAYGNRVSIVNEAIGGNRVVNPVTSNANNDAPSTSGEAAVDRLARDVLELSGLTHVIWLGSSTAAAGRSAASLAPTRAATAAANAGEISTTTVSGPGRHATE